MRICFSFISGHEKFIHPPPEHDTFSTPQRLRFSTRIVSEVVDSGWLVGGFRRYSRVTFHCSFVCLCCLLYGADEPD